MYGGYARPQTARKVSYINNNLNYHIENKSEMEDTSTEEETNCMDGHCYAHGDYPSSNGNETSEDTDSDTDSDVINLISDSDSDTDTDIDYHDVGDDTDSDTDN